MAHNLEKALYSNADGHKKQDICLKSRSVLIHYWKTTTKNISARGAFLKHCTWFLTTSVRGLLNAFPQEILISTMTHNYFLYVLAISVYRAADFREEFPTTHKSKAALG